ncbi:helix-turn-helix transcriptional regulator [Chryseobacterium sp. NFX27]|uniref:helix-turn-helix transcriptional regulator n=1 Tax=Chryseobacterium sp. NFX27 TaxID=2819618 RepID=UPI003CFAE92A
MLPKQNKKEYEKNFNICYMVIGGVTTVVSLMYYLLFFSDEEKKEKKTSLSEQKTEEAFDEIIQLAKNNSPEFWAHFQEKYPEFRKKLIKINAHLKVSELIFCAYIYLGFNTKDIAKYTFKAVQTIKNNKYNLRKRLNIPPKDDTTLWLRKNLDE